jgi:prolipoprotein diacylglyceryl transferase
VIAIGVIVFGSIPSPARNAITIGPITLRMYGLMIAIGVIAAVWLLGRQLEDSGLGTRDDASSIGIWGVAAGIIGARLYHVFTDWSRFSDNLSAIPKIWQGGLGIPGGLIAGITVGAWQAKRRGIRPAVAVTFGVPAIALAQAIGRWGNWWNQELFGKPTDLPWALEIDNEHLPPGYPPGTTFHPTFLYESFWNLLLCGFLLWVQKRYQLAAGRLLGVYLIGYGIGRFWIEGLRIDPSHMVGGLRWNQWVALAAIAGGAIYLLLTRGKKWDEQPRVAVVEGDDVGDSQLGGDEPARDEGAPADDIESERDESDSSEDDEPVKPSTET